MRRARGRPRRIDAEAATERIWAWLTPSERRALERCAADVGADLAVVIREAVNEYVADYGERRVFSVTGNSESSVSSSCIQRSG